MPKDPKKVKAGKANRRKGLDAERELVNLLKKRGLTVERIPLSGAGRFQGHGGDVVIEPNPGTGRKLHLEVKKGKHVPKVLYDWMADNFGLCVRRDRERWLAVIRVEDLAHLLAGEAAWMQEFAGDLKHGETLGFFARRMKQRAEDAEDRLELLRGEG